MSLAVRELRRDDNAALLELCRATTTGSSTFTVDRAPDFFALGDSLADSREGVIRLGAFDAEPRLLGTLVIARQRRTVGACVRHVHYVHDLRVCPSARGRGVAKALVGEGAGCVSGDPFWFATVLGDNPHAPTVLSGFSPRFAQPALLGRSAHVGLPLFGIAGHGLAGEEVVELTEAEFETMLPSLTKRASFAPAEWCPWRAFAGDYLAVSRRGRIVAVAKLCFGEPGRRFVALRDLPGGALLRRLCAWSGAAPPPLRGGALAIATAAFFAAIEQGPWDLALRRFVMSRRRGRATYLFVGMGERDARARRFPLGTVTFRSSTWRFGAPASPPRALSMDVHELLLM